MVFGFKLDFSNFPLFNVKIAVSFSWIEILRVRQVLGCVKLAVRRLLSVDTFILVRVFCCALKVE